jgi:hypothetical protein
MGRSPGRGGGGGGVLIGWPGAAGGHTLCPLTGRERDVTV